MENCKPSSIYHKKEINEMCKALVSARRALKEENPLLLFNDIQLLRLVLLGCLNLIFLGADSPKETVNNDDLFADVNSLLGNKFVETYTGYTKKELVNIGCSSAMKCLNAMRNIVSWKGLLPYALEILEYSEEELESANRDRRDGVVTKKKKQSGVYYTPYDVADYMINECLGRLRGQGADLLDSRYIDFSCGSGVFLLQLIEYVIDQNPSIDYEGYCRFVRQSIFGVDISPYAVECCQFTILQCAVNRYKNSAKAICMLLSFLRKNIIVADATNMDVYYNTHSDFPRRFDCIVGNPPYVGSSSGDNGLIKSNLFIPFLYNLQKFSNEKSICSLVLPLSFSYNNQSGFRKMRLNIEADNAEWLVEHYDRSPDSLFGDDVKSRACIVFRISAPHHTIRTTGLMRWTSNSREKLLTTSKAYADITALPIEAYIPKLSHRCEIDAYNKVLAPRCVLSDLLRVQNSFHQGCMVIKGTAYNWICAYDHLPPSFNVDGSAYISKDLRIYSFEREEDKYYTLAYLNSKLAFWLWTVIGDGFHVTNRLLSALGIVNDPNAYGKLVTLGKNFAEEIKKYPTTSVNKGKIITNYEHKYLMDIISQIDAALIEVLNIDKHFLTYLEQWYVDIVNCGRQAANECQK